VGDVCILSLSNTGTRTGPPESCRPPSGSGPQTLSWWFWSSSRQRADRLVPRSPEARRGGECDPPRQAGPVEDLHGVRALPPRSSGVGVSSGPCWGSLVILDGGLGGPAGGHHPSGLEGPAERRPRVHPRHPEGHGGTHYKIKVFLFTNVTTYYFHLKIKKFSLIKFVCVFVWKKKLNVDTVVLSIIKDEYFYFDT